MSDTDEMFIEEHDGQFALVRVTADGTRTSLPLPETGVLSLGRVAQQATAEILARRQPRSADASPAIVFPVAKLQIAPDVHMTQLQFQLTDEFGNVVTFGFSLGQLEWLADKLPAHIQRLRDAAAKKTTQ